MTSIAVCNTLSDMKKAIAFRLSEEAIRLLVEMAKANGLSQASMLELLIRKEAKKSK